MADTQEYEAVYRIAVRRALMPGDPAALQLHFEVPCSSATASAGFSIIRTDTVGRVRKQGSWSLDFGISPDEDMIHVAWRSSCINLPEAEREHWAAHAMTAARQPDVPLDAPRTRLLLRRRRAAPVVALRLPAAMHDEMVQHAIEDLPNECCGIIPGRMASRRASTDCRNAEASPFRYNIDPRDILKVEREMDDHGWQVLVIYHSHVASDAYPSPTDVRLSQWPGTDPPTTSIPAPTTSSSRSRTATTPASAPTPSTPAKSPKSPWRLTRSRLLRRCPMAVSGLVWTTGTAFRLAPCRVP